MIKAVLFDFDGTLTRPEAIDFAALRKLLGCPPGTPILEYIEALPSAEAQARAHRVLDEFEMAAARASVPNDGAEELVAHLRSRGIARGILSRNTRGSVLLALANFSAVTGTDFSVILTRENAGLAAPGWCPGRGTAVRRGAGGDPRGGRLRVRHCRRQVRRRAYGPCHQRTGGVAHRAGPRLHGGAPGGDPADP